MAKANRLRMPRVHEHTLEEMRALYEGTYHQWIQAGGALALRQPPELRRALMLMADISPTSPEARRLKGIWAVEMLSTCRQQWGGFCDVEAIVISALLDFIGRQQ